MVLETLRPAADSRAWRYGATAAALALAAACQGAPAAPDSAAPSAAGSRFSAQPSPTGTVTPPSESCDSIRAVQPGDYFSRRYAPHIDEQLALLKVAYAKNSNVDLDHDLVFRYIPLLHAMENDPQYALAMRRAARIIKRDPDTSLSAGDLLQWDIPAPELCAPERLTDAASRQQLAITGEVGLDVGEALAGHLADQGTRGAKLLAAYLTHKMQEFGRYLQEQTARLDPAYTSR